MKRYKLIVSYDGTYYHGFAKQNNAVTIQGTLENALEALFQIPTAITGAGRTDTGVHAKGQCCTFDVNTHIPVNRLARAINSKLPKDIVVKDVEIVEDSFHPRFSAKRKTYRYLILNSTTPDPFLYQYSYFYPYTLDIQAMKEASQYIIGMHDFACFCSAGSSVQSTIREVYSLIINQNDELIVIDICGNGFLYNMVRIIVGTLLEVGAGKKSVGDVKRVIESKNRNLAGYTAPPEGLTMLNIVYESNSYELPILSK